MSCYGNETQVLDNVVISTANTARDGSGVAGVVCTGASATTGTYVDYVTIKAESATTAGMIRFFIRDTGGAVVTLIGEVPVNAVTPSGTSSSYSAIFKVQRTLRNNTWQLEATTNNAETFHITAYGEYGVKV